jgi:ABC-type transport system involved in Fe-S cluster assembly fused permease/ATPase subunit
VAHALPSRDERAGQPRHTRAVDALLNYETVKYFNNEASRPARYDDRAGAPYRARQVKSQTTLSLLNPASS